VQTTWFFNVEVYHHYVVCCSSASARPTFDSCQNALQVHPSMEYPLKVFLDVSLLILSSH
jgi:hypothetical protein